jgi:nicotinamidase-related amidase
MIRINDVAVFETPEELLKPLHSAVLVIDMQNETASEEGGYAKHGHDISRIRSAIPAIQRVLEASRGLSLPIVFTEFVHRDRRGLPLVDGPSVYLHRHEKWISDVTDGSWAARTLEEFAPQPGELIMQKSRASALYGTYCLGSAGNGVRPDWV